MRELNLRKCLSCGVIVKVIDDCNCSCKINCCDKVMTDIVPNSVDASFEKHVPTYEIKDDNLIVKVDHVMEEDHYIMWIAFITENEEYVTYFKPGDEAVTTFPNKKGILYAYCNKHSLWNSIVK